MRVLRLVPIALSLAMVVATGISIERGTVPAHAIAVSSHNVALVPNAIGENCCTGTMPTAGTVGGTSDDLGSFSFADMPVGSVSNSALAAYDTLVLVQVSTSEFTSQQKTDINAFINDGGKLIIYDSDATTGEDYTWLDRPFSTFPPCANCGLTGGSLSVATDSTLASSVSSSADYINASEIPPNTDAVGDSNVIQTSDPNWYGELRATDGRGNTGWVEGYAESSSGSGILIYNGLDEDFIGSTGYAASAVDWIGKLWYQELAQQWDPSGLPDTNPIAAPQFTVNVGAFIPGNYIQAPPVQGWCTGLGGRFPHIHVLPPQRLYFAGDNRSSFDPNGSFRARQLVTVVPDESASESGLAAGTMPKNEVGESKEYAQDALDNNGQLDSSDDDGVLGDCHLLDDEGTASNKDMHVAVSRLGPKKVSVHLYGSASNPLVAPLGVNVAPPVHWDFTVTIDTSGTQPSYSLTHACFTQFPAFEVFINNILVYGISPGDGPWPDWTAAQGLYAQTCLSTSVDGDL